MSLPSSSLRRPRLLIVGCGDVGMRVLKLLDSRWQVFALTSSAERFAALRDAGAVPLLGNLDEPATLARLAGLAEHVLHMAPPASCGATDERSRHLLQALALRKAPRSLIYVSTTGVYGDCSGARFDETRATAPATERGQRRVDAEQQLRLFARRFGTRVCLLRVPGIYAPDRAGGHPRERLLSGAPVLRREEDVYTNHIHADDLARACVAALFHALPQRAVHVCDDTELLMGDYFDLAAELCGLARPPRLSRAEAAAQMSPVRLSFMSESRRLANVRLKRELRLKLRYPTVREGLV